MLFDRIRDGCHEKDRPMIDLLVIKKDFPDKAVSKSEMSPKDPHVDRF